MSYFLKKYQVSTIKVTFLFSLFLFVGSAKGQESLIEGDWIVNIETDAFSDQVSVEALNSPEHGKIMALTCKSGEFEFRVMYVDEILGPHYSEDDSESTDVKVLMRVDQGEIITIIGSRALDTQSFYFFNKDAEELVKKLLAPKAKQVAFRPSTFIDETPPLTSVHSLIGLGKALSHMTKAGCEL